MSAWLSRCPPGFQSPASCEGEAYHREKKVRERWEERGKMSRAQGETVQNRLRRKRETKGREGTPGSGEGRVTGCLLCRSAGRRVIRTGTKSCNIRAPPVVQWWTIHLPTQGTRVQSLVWEDSTCLRATKPEYQDCWARALEPRTTTPGAHAPYSLCPAARETTAMRSPPTTTRE